MDAKFEKKVVVSPSRYINLLKNRSRFQRMPKGRASLGSVAARPFPLACPLSDVSARASDRQLVRVALGWAVR
jgi:hypothetical protein